MKLVKNWKQVLSGAWSVRLMVIAAVVSVLGAFLSIVSSDLLGWSPTWFAVVASVFNVLAIPARVIMQEGIKTFRSFRSDESGAIGRRGEISKQMFGEPPGFCFKSRYAYVDNSPGITGGNFKKLDGLTPSIANAVSAMSPEKTLSISLGYSVPGFRMQPCDKIATAKFTTIRDLAEYIEDDLTVDNPVRLTRQHIDAIVREVLRLSKNPTQRNGLVKIKEKPYHLMEPSEIKDMIENLKKIIKVNPDNSTFNKSMINSNKDIFTVKKKSAMATQMYIFHNIKAYMVTWISEPPEKPITKPMRLVFCDEYAGGVCRLSNGLQFKNPYIQDTWAPFITIKIGNFRMSNLKPDKPVDGEPENFSQMTKKYTEKDRLYHSSIILLVLVCILYIISIR